MQRHLRRALTTTIYPLIGLAGLIAMSGCAAVPAVNMLSSLMKPSQPAASGTAAPSSDMFTSLAQKLGITVPTAQTANQAAPDATLVDTPGTTATAAK